MIGAAPGFERLAPRARDLDKGSYRDLDQAVAGGADARSSSSQREETRSACISMVALVGPYCSPSRRSHDSVDSAMVIAGASEPAL